MPTNENEKVTLSDGFYVVKLTEPKEIKAATGGPHGDQKYNFEHTYYSLRDRSGKQRAVMQVNPETNELIQVSGEDRVTYRLSEGTSLHLKRGEYRGEKVAVPKLELLPYIGDFVQRKGFDILDIPPENTGLLQKDGKYYNIYNLPDGFEYKGKSGMTWLPLNNMGPIKLPDGFILHGDLELFNNHVPDKLNVKGKLILDGRREAGFDHMPLRVNVGNYAKADNVIVHGAWFRERYKKAMGQPYNAQIGPEWIQYGQKDTRGVLRDKGVGRGLGRDDFDSKDLVELVDKKLLSVEEAREMYRKADYHYFPSVDALVNKGIITRQEFVASWREFITTGGRFESEISDVLKSYEEKGLLTGQEVQELTALKKAHDAASKPTISLTDPAEKIAGEVGREMTSKQGVTGGETPAEIKTPAERADERKVQEQRGTGEHGKNPKPKGR